MCSISGLFSVQYLTLYKAFPLGTVSFHIIRHVDPQSFDPNMKCKILNNLMQTLKNEKEKQAWKTSQFFFFTCLMIGNVEKDLQITG